VARPSLAIMSSRRPPLRRPAESVTRLRRVLGAGQHEQRERAARVAENERRAGPPPENVQDLPEEVLQLVTRQLARASAGNALDLCDSVRNWCRTHPASCADDSMWREVFELAFGAPTIPNPLRQGQLHAPSWRAALNRVCAALDALPAERQQAWAGVASWTDEQLDRAIAGFANEFAPDAPRQMWAALGALLHARGASLARHTERLERRRWLLSAIFHRRVDLVRQELANGAEADYVDEHGTSRLHEAMNPWSKPQDPEVVRLLLENGARAIIDLRDNFGHAETKHELFGYTALTMAVIHRNVEVVRLLLEAGANPNVMCSQWPDGSEAMTARQRLTRMGGFPAYAPGQQILALLNAHGAR
jgi:hypothetical protein